MRRRQAIALAALACEWVADQLGRNDEVAVELREAAEVLRQWLVATRPAEIQECERLLWRIAKGF